MEKNKEMPKAYEPDECEDKIYKEWEESGFFNPDNLAVDDNAPSYTIVMPPPNVTGTLHLGHASMLAIEDILTRYHRMKGYRALWLPGADHAAIATQTKVEKIIKEEGTNRHEMGREKFLKRVEDFAQNSHDTIVNQVKKLGSSCDWSREAYTLDETRNKAVRSVFKLMYDDGLIYRGDRVVNWCPRCHSTLADDEVEYKSQKAKLYTFKYSADFPIEIASTRPETKLGDTAVAVNPSDERYKDYVGKTYEVDFCGQKLKLKVIADRNIDMEFGTGALGVTPAHSMIDAQMAEEHGLASIKVIDEDGKIHQGFGEYSGLPADEARQKIVERLKTDNLLIKEDGIDNNLSICYRCDTPIEPLPSLQWFINVNREIPRYGKSIKQLSVEAVKSGVFGRDKIKIVPDRFEKNYFHWMESLRDWCIIRQIWFGHRVPVWYKPNNVNLVLVRHAQTDWNVQHIMQGQTDIPLNDNGKKQAQELKELVKEEKIDAMIISPLTRTRQTAEIINTFGHELKIDDRLKERGYGKFEGKKTEEILAEHPEITTFEVNGCPYWIDVPTAETYDEVRARVAAFLEDVKREYAGKTVLIVSHGDTLDMFYAILNNVPNEKAYGQFSRTANMMKFELAAEETYVGIEAPQEDGWHQDEDTLDTWFSSGLWTFSTLANSPDQIKIEDGKIVVNTDDFKKFHPNSVLETGYDILFFWVARMIIMTTYALGDIPFQNVYLHGLVLDEKGKKMSKSKGNAIDPLEMIDKYGTDAVRLALVIGSTPGNDLRMNEEKIAGFRNLVNKIWNIYRYIISNTTKLDPDESIKVENLTVADRWISFKFQVLVKQITDDIKDYRFSQAGERLREFTWNDLADWYLEACKFDKGKETEKVMYNVAENLLKLWHPFIPFITEKLYENFSDKSLIVAKWPEGVITESIYDEFEKIKNIITAIRNARAENKVEPAQKVKAVIYAGDRVEFIKSQAELIKGMRAGIESLEIVETGEKIDKAIFVSVDGIDIYLAGAMDAGKEKARLEKEQANLAKLIEAQRNKLSNREFVDKAPAAVVEKEREKLAGWESELEKLEERLKEIE